MKHIVLLLSFFSQLEKAHWVFEVGRSNERKSERDFVEYKNMLDQHVQFN